MTIHHKPRLWAVRADGRLIGIVHAPTTRTAVNRAREQLDEIGNRRRAEFSVRPTGLRITPCV